MAFTTAAPDGSPVMVRDLRAATTATVAGGGAYELSLSADGRRVACTGRGGDTGVFVRDLRTGATLLASRADGAAGAPAMGASGHPSLAADGRRVAFTCDAWNLSPRKCNPARGVFVRDLRRNTTTLVSTGDGANRWLGPTKGSSTGSEMCEPLLCA